MFDDLADELRQRVQRLPSTPLDSCALVTGTLGLHSLDRPTGEPLESMYDGLASRS